MEGFTERIHTGADMGLVIGKNGKNIKHIRETSGRVFVLLASELNLNSVTGKLVSLSSVL